MLDIHVYKHEHARSTFIMIAITFNIVASRKQSIYFALSQYYKKSFWSLTYLTINITIMMSARRNTKPPAIPTPRTRLAGTTTLVPFNSTLIEIKVEQWVFVSNYMGKLFGFLFRYWNKWVIKMTSYCNICN